jgi:hypothetical protein
MRQIFKIIYQMLVTSLVIAYFDKVFFDSYIGFFFDEISDLLGFLWWLLSAPGMTMGYYFSHSDTLFFLTFTLGQLSAVVLLVYIYKVVFGTKQSNRF